MHMCLEVHHLHGRLKKTSPAARIKKRKLAWHGHVTINIVIPFIWPYSRSCCKAQLHEFRDYEEGLGRYRRTTSTIGHGCHLNDLLDSAQNRTQLAKSL